MQKRVGIIGAGISGLNIAWQLKKAGMDVFVWEHGAQAGGMIQSLRKGEWLFEYGPNSLQVTDTRIRELIHELGLDNELVFAKKEAKNRYIVKNGKLHALPSSPLKFLQTPIFSTAAKLRVLVEPLVRGPRDDHEESVADFVRRRLGQEFLDYAINPFVGGIYAGDPEKLSFKYAFPLMYELEQRYGSLIKAQLKSAERYKKGNTAIPRSKAEIVSFKEGLGSLSLALAAKLNGCIHYSDQIRKIRQDEYGRWQIMDQSLTHVVDELVVTVPHHKLKNMDAPFTSFIKQGVTYPAVQVVHLGFRKDQLQHAFDGFGMLIPKVEGESILGTVFSSSLFEHRAPNDHVLLTNFIGGARNRDTALMNDETLVALALNTHKNLKTIKADAVPVQTHVVRWNKAIPQYELGYGAVLRELEQIESDFGHIHFAGNYRYGISMVDSILSGFKLSERLSHERN